MDDFKRYGLYVVPKGQLFEMGSAWLGWNSVSGEQLAHPQVDGLPDAAEALTSTPRKYGFHGTIKPPFVLRNEFSVQALHDAAANFCAGHAKVHIPKLTIRKLGGFVAIVPDVPSTELENLAAATVETLDPFRAPPTEAEFARRRKAGLTDRQEKLLQLWGYPHVFEEFRFHMTLTGRTKDAAVVATALSKHFADVLAKPFTIDSLALMGEREDGYFHLIHRYPLLG